MRTVCFITAGVLTFLTAASAQPVLNAGGVLNAASYKPGIASGSIFVAFGSAMGPGTLVSSSLPFKDELSDTKVTFTPAAGGVALSALIVYTSSAQLAALLPSTATPGSYNVTVTYKGATSAPINVDVVARNFGFVTQASSGSGPAQVTYGGFDLNRFTTGSANFSGHTWQLRPTHTGETNILWGTGVGSDLKSDVTGESSGDQRVAGGFMVNVGGVDVQPDYVGRSPGSPGLDQVNFKIPANAPRGCFTNVKVKFNGGESNIGTIAIAEAGASACTHPTFSESQLKKLDTGGTLTFGSLSLSKISTKTSFQGTSFDIASEGAYGSFAKYTIGTVADSAFSYTQNGACYVYHRAGTTQEIGNPTLPIFLDAGAQLLLNGPGATNTAMPSSTLLGGKFYSATLYSSGVGGVGGSGTPTLTQGTYTIAGPGGADVKAFTASTDFPGQFVWTNQDTLPDPIPRGSGLVINWTGGTTGVVSISGSATKQTGGTEANPIFELTGFYCTAPASANTFTVPSNILQQLIVVSNDPTSGGFGSLGVFAMPDFAKGQGKFTAELTAGGQVDYAFFSYTVGSSKSTGWQ